MPQDAVLKKTGAYYDFSLDEDGQIVVDDFFDSALLYSLLGEQRADESEVQESSRRRGWIGNENTNYENGSKLWLYSQSRTTRSVLNSVQNEAYKCLTWLVKDGFAVSIDEPIAEISGDNTLLNVTIRRSGNTIVSRSYELWNNTGIR